MRILQKHVTKEILVPFAIAFVTVTSLTVVGNLLRELTDRFMNKGLALSDIGVIVLYALPMLISYTLPIALLFATLVAFIQFSQDCEIIAMKAAGIPIRRIFAPAILIGIVSTMFLLVLRTEVSPWARRGLKIFIIDTVLKKPTLVLREQAWTHEVDNMRIFVGDIDDTKMLLKDVSIMINSEDSPDRTIVATSGKIFVGGRQKQIFLELNDGSIHEYDMDKPDRYSTTTFQSMTIPVSIDSLERYMRSSRSYQKHGRFRTKEMSLSQINQKLFDPHTTPDDRRSLLRHVGERTALAFMPLTFVLIGVPLGIIPYKARRFYGPAICAGLLVAYYSLLMLGEMLAKKGLMNPLIAMWIPNLLLGSAGVAFMVRAERR